jgi:teichuronic acid biosynthesis glycosyltransferase TuaC
VRDGEDGLLFPRKDSEALANALELLVRQPELRRQLGGNGRLASQKYRWEVVAGQVEEYYESCRQAAFSAAPGGLYAFNGTSRPRAT